MIYSSIEDMDIKSGGREMAAVVYSNDEDGICCSFSFNHNNIVLQVYILV